jgi:hypothetical protein
MNDRVMLDPPRAPDGYAQGSIWCVILGLGLLVAVAVSIAAGVG